MRRLINKGTEMRALALIALLTVGGCDVRNEPAEDRVTVEYDEARIKESADRAGRAAKDVATGVANVAEETGKAIKREVGDVDVDVKVTRESSAEKSPDASKTP